MMNRQPGAAPAVAAPAPTQAGTGEFEFRRAHIWRTNRVLVVASVMAIALSIVVASVLNMPAQLSWLAGAVAGSLVAFTVARVVRALNVLYRCPNCGLLPYRTLNEYKCGGLGPTRSNFMSPRACPYCGTRIR
jgi:hypothetical protein